MTTLHVESRDLAGKKVAKLRAEGKVPGVVYGHKIDSLNVTIPRRALEIALKEGGESTVMPLKGLEEEHEVLITNIDIDPVSQLIQHVDFYAIEKGRSIEVTVPLHFIGEEKCEAVTSLGGMLVKVLHEVTVETLPKDLPSHLDVDVSGLKAVTDSIHVSDIKVPAGVVIKAEPTDPVVAIDGPRDLEAEDAAAVETIDISEIPATSEKPGATDGVEEAK